MADLEVGIIETSKDKGLRVFLTARKFFYVLDPENPDKKLLTDQTWKGLGLKVADWIRRKRRFKALYAYTPEHGRVKLTSLVAGSDDIIRFTFKDAQGNLLKETRRLQGYSRLNPEYSFFQDTEHNTMIWRRIQKRNILIHELQQKISYLQKQFTKPIKTVPGEED